MVGVKRLELPCRRRLILSQVRLPISPHAHIQLSISCFVHLPAPLEKDIQSFSRQSATRPYSIINFLPVHKHYQNNYNLTYKKQIAIFNYFFSKKFYFVFYNGMQINKINNISFGNNIQRKALNTKESIALIVVLI